MGTDTQSSNRPLLRPTKIQLGMVIAAAVLLPVVPVGVASRYGGLANLEHNAGGFGRQALGYLTIGLIALLVYFATRRRTLWPGVVTFVVLMVLVTGLISLVVYQDHKWRESAIALRNAKVEREIATLRQSTRDALRTEGIMEDAVASKRIGDEAFEKMGQLSQGLSDTPAIVGRAMVDIMKELSAARGEYLKRVDRFSAEGGLEASTLKSRETIVRRRALLGEAIEQQGKVLEIMRAQDERLFQRCIELGLSEGSASAARHEFAAQPASTPLFKIQELESDAVQLIDDYLDVLQRNWGHWSFTGGTIEFDETIDPESASRLNKILDRIKRITEEQQVLQKAAFEAGSKKDK